MNQNRLQDFTVNNTSYYENSIIDSNRILQYNYNILNENNKVLLSEINMLKSKIDELLENNNRQQDEIKILTQLLEAKNSIIYYLQNKKY